MRSFIRMNRAILMVGLSWTAMAPAHAQTNEDNKATAGSGVEDIIVTARKREESLISVPVVVTAVSGKQLENRGINNADALARIVPQLIIGEGSGTVQGGNIALRGISGADANPFADQAVSFNIDGVQVARASIRRMANMDIQQIEVLKGPQALFFGKNSPGGIISIRTADPGDHFEAKASVGYEFNAREWRGEGYVSTPLSDTVGFRLAGFYDHMDGWVKNVVPDSSPFVPDSGRAPRSKEFALRGTLKFTPSDRFDARVKLAYGEVSGDSSSANTQFVNCPVGGRPQSGVPDDCTPDDHVSVGYVGTAIGKIDPRFGDGKTFLKQRQMLGSVEMNYQLSDQLQLTSVTGLYYVRLRNLANFTSSYVGATMLPSLNRMNIRELSEELRLSSDFDGPINFVLGGYFQDSNATAGSTTWLNANAPLLINNYLLEQNGNAYSGFLQMMWDITDTLELSTGGRYSYERKKLVKVTSQAAFSKFQYPPPAITPANTSNSWNDFSPEITLTYRPSSDLTVFGSYKHGFISGGFNSGSADFTRPLDYDPQTVKGFEGGLKAALLDRALFLNFALYTYKINGLQVQVTTQGTVQELKNAGKVSSKGGEFDFNYRTPVEGLALHGAVAYNKGRYDKYFGNCYRGQSQALGCNFVPVTGSPGEAVPVAAGQTGTLQNLAGTELIRSPAWTGNLGFTYETPVGAGLKLGLSGDATFSGSYLTDATSKPEGRSPSYTLLDASMRIGAEDERWEIALIGRNLTNQYYWTRVSDNPFTGTAPGNATGPAVLGDAVASISRGREIMLRVSTKF